MREQVARPDTHQYPSNRGREGFREAVAGFYADPLRRGARPRRPRSSPRWAPRRPSRTSTWRSWTRATSRSPATPGYPVYTTGPLLAGADAVPMPLLARAGLPPGPRGHPGGRGAPGAADVPQLPEQPDRRRGRRRLLREGRGVRAPQRRDRRPRQRLLGDHLRRLPRALVPRDPGRAGRRHRDLLPLEDLQHDRLAGGRGGRQPRPRGRLLAAQDEHRQRHVRGPPGGRGGGAPLRPVVGGGDVRDLPAPARRAGGRAAGDRPAGRPAQGRDLRLGAGARRRDLGVVHRAGARGRRRGDLARGGLRAERRGLREDEPDGARTSASTRPPSGSPRWSPASVGPPELQVRILRPGGRLPVRAHPGDAGLDLGGRRGRGAAAGRARARRDGRSPSRSRPVTRAWCCRARASRAATA